MSHDLPPDHAADSPAPASAPLRHRYDWAYYYAGPNHLVLVPLLLVAAFATGFWIFWAWAAVSFIISVAAIRLMFRDVRRQGNIPSIWYWEKPRS
jgi:hypothetical protein